MNVKFYHPKNSTPIDRPEQWEELHKKGHWRTGYSAKALAYSWTDAGGFPPEVQSAFDKSGFPALEKLEFKCGSPEYKLKLPGGRAPSTNDIFVWAHGNDGVVCISVEGKVKEHFGEPINKWFAKSPGTRDVRLRYLLKTTDLRFEEVQNIHYQLLHRTASALIEAEENSKCKTAMMLVHSFSQTHEKFHDFAAFARAMGAKVKSVRAEDCIFYAKNINGIDLYLGWVTGEEKYLHK